MDMLVAEQMCYYILLVHHRGATFPVGIYIFVFIMFVSEIMCTLA